MIRKSRDEHLFSAGPKRILALDGGGIRGILTLQVLRRIETLLRTRTGGDDNFRLSDYFDLIGGTSTGAIIAAGLATGMSVDELEVMYADLGESIFQDDLLRWGVLRAKFSKEPLEQALRRQFGETKIGDQGLEKGQLRTGLAIMLKRLDTGGPWIVHNNPRGKYFGPRHGGRAIPNSQFPLWQIVRSSTAAPHYFDPELFPVAKDSSGNDINGAFVDGGVSPHNNPALQLVMLVWMRNYGFQWPVGEQQLLVVSLGTGATELAAKAIEVEDTASIKTALTSLGSLMDDVRTLNEIMLQWMSASPTARQIDREIGDLSGDFIGGHGSLLSYLRYDAWLREDWLRANVREDYPVAQVKKLAEMDEPKNMPALIEIGKGLARKVEEAHFPACFDV